MWGYLDGVIRFQVFWITFSSLVQHGRDTEDKVSADVCHWCLNNTLAVLQTTITLESFPAAVSAGVSSLWGREDFQVLTVRHQYNLRGGKPWDWLKTDRVSQVRKITILNISHSYLVKKYIYINTVTPHSLHSAKLVHFFISLSN